MLQKWAEPSDGRQDNLVEQMAQASWRQSDGELMSNPNATITHPLQSNFYPAFPDKPTNYQHQLIIPQFLAYNTFSRKILQRVTKESSVLQVSEF